MTSGATPLRPSTRRVVVAVAALAAILVLVGLWTFSSLRDAVDARAVLAAGRRIAAEPLAPLVLLGAYVVAGLVMMPFAILMGATIVVFGAWPGVAFALVGALVAGSLVFGLGRAAGRSLASDWLRRHRGSLLDDLDRQLARRGVLAVALVRLTPFPFSLVNAIAGVSDVRYRDFVIGTAIGLVPILTLMASVSGRVDAWLEDPEPTQFVALAAMLVVACAVAWWLRGWAARRLDRPDDER